MSCQQTQKQAVLAYARKHKFITRYVAAVDLGVMNLWARISELEDEDGIRFDSPPHFERERQARPAVLGTRRALGEGSVIEKGQERLDSVAYPASRFCVGLETLPAHRKSALGTVSSTQGAVLAVGTRATNGLHIA